MGAMNKLRQNTGVILWILVLSFGIIWTLQDSDVFSAMNQTTRNVATVNGTPVQNEDYQRILKRQRQRFQQQLGGDMNPQMESRVREQAYNQVINQELLQQEMERLGISVTDSEVEEMVFGENPHPVIRRQFADSTGQINYQLLQNMASNPEARTQWIKLEEFLRRQRRQQKMSSLVQSTIQVSEADIEDHYRRQNASASAQYVGLRYARVPDDSITVTESDLRNYYDNNREDYKREKTVTLQYATTSKEATAEDSSGIAGDLNDLRTDFRATENDSLFLLNNASDQDFSREYRTPDQMSARIADSVYAAPEPGRIVGPVFGGGQAHLLKIRGTRPAENDFLHARHILLETNQADPEQAGRLQAIRDSVESGAASFAELARRYSDDGSASDGGDLGWFARGSMVDAFEEAAFGAEPGSLVGPIRSEFGYHLIRVEARAEQAVRVTDLAYNLSPSQATLSDKESQLGDLAYFAEEEGGFAEEAQRLGLSVEEVQVETDQSSVPGIGQSAALSQFLESASDGAISDVIELSNKFVVAEVTNVTPEGYRSFSEVKAQIRPQVELQKKRAVQTRRMERALAQNSFDALPEVLNTERRTQSDITYSTSTVPGLGQEPQFVGTVFGLDEGETSGVVAGANAAFVVQTTQKTSPPPLTDQKRQQLLKQLLKQRRQQVSSDWIAALKEDASIEDNRTRLR
ncbi:peptidyl-prolyl cis-trans isomerase [Salinibacter altiplanensis]|uniref:peptidyl-prolyl cis-trans isomerase n=1 Tax=Salinibacter altiplanensis TaxID=1803181 RepID=UPI000C9F55BC|nr:peptidyl-prolyl cis-trans isomerase [Salinibacter altiplanensis]